MAETLFFKENTIVRITDFKKYKYEKNELIEK